MPGDLLNAILTKYLESGDFNGLYLDATDAERIADAVQLTRAGLVQVVTEADFPNPHVRPWPSRRTVDDQVASLESLAQAEYGLCLYPTPLALAENPACDTSPDEPYRKAMAEGRGALELAFFRFEVLEQYRNDPRYSFRFGDFGAEAVISDDAYLDEDEPEHDKIIMRHIGFAYDLSGYDKEDPESAIIRRVCAFYSDLAKLSPTHQQRWRTYQVDDGGLTPHPAWLAPQMGHWPDGRGPFARLAYELETLNTLHERAFGEALFFTTDRPETLGWILRPSQREWDDFVLTLDKLLSDNIRHDGLSAAGVPRRNDAGEVVGTIVRLSWWLEALGLPEADVRAELAPMREIRSARQIPAHALRRNVTDVTLIHRQVDLMERVNMMIRGLRHFWQTHPANSAWEEPDHIRRLRNYRM